MKTPIQELIEIMKQRINDDDAIPFMYNEKILELAESMLEKEKQFMKGVWVDGKNSRINGQDPMGQIKNL